MTPPNPTASVIIVNWNGRRFLRCCLASLRAQSFRDFETIFVDNGSGDGSLDLVTHEFQEVRTIDARQNLGFARANILGYSAARGQLIALLNNDTEAHPDWLAALVDAATRHPAAGSFASKMLFFGQRDRIENCGHALCPGGFTTNWGRAQPDGPEWNIERPVFGPCGGAALYRRSMIQDVGFLDPDLGMTYEDFDLAYRAQLRGYSCVFVPRAIVYHHFGGTMKARRPQQTFYSQRNIEIVYWKNTPPSLIISELPQRLCYEIGAATHAALSGQLPAFLKAKVSALHLLPATIRKRRLVQAHRTVAAPQLRRAMRRSGGISTKAKKLLTAAGLLDPGPVQGE